MAYNEATAARIRKRMRRRKGIREKKMFGGICFLLDGNMCVGVWKESLIARVGLANYDEALAEVHAREFDVTGRPMKGWVMIEPAGFESDGELQHWIDLAAGFTRSLPSK